jgi:hypothetical protein
MAPVYGPLLCWHHLHCSQQGQGQRAQQASTALPCESLQACLHALAGHVHNSSTCEPPPAALPPAEYPLSTMAYKGCTLEYWAKCKYQQPAFDFCKARGGDLFSYIDRTDLDTFYNFVMMQTSATRYASVACTGYEAYYPSIGAFLWTGLRSATGDQNCGMSCVWQDMGTGENVTDINSIRPCWMIQDGSSIQFHIRDSAPEGACLNGGSNDANPNSWLSHYICRTNCGG